MRTVKFKRAKILVILVITVISGFMLLFFQNKKMYSLNPIESEEIKAVVEEIFIKRNQAILDENLDYIKTIYNLNTKYGKWAYEYEHKKMKYIHNWEQKQGVKFIEVKPDVVVKWVKGGGDRYTLNLLCSTEYKYVYDNNLGVVNTCKIGTYHFLQLERINDSWIITKEWYKDPFGDSLNLDNIKADSIKNYILSQEYRDFSNINERRKKSVEYAKRYCGAAGYKENGYQYNKKYRDFNIDGGDCANFASQILFEGGKFRKNTKWNYDRGNATGAWVNADKFKQYMINSGRASVIAYGNYDKVYKASYKLLPGDFVAYEKNKDITHISVVTGADSKGYSLVTCHNTDRNDVPWDLGWSDKKIKFWLVRVHY